MKKTVVLFIVLLCAGSFAESNLLLDAMKSSIEARDVACVFVNCASNEIFTPDSSVITTRYTPCSTFKIWNTLIGAECQLIGSVDDSFYIWDSIPRFLPAWNRDLTLKEAFSVSCVPSFQALAKKIGTQRMITWIETLNYGDKDISSGIDDFWLPREGKKSIMISPLEQAQLIRKLVTDELPFSEKSKSILQEVMLIEKTAKGIYFGKTGSGTIIGEKKGKSIGWFAGYCTSKGTTYSFACLIKGENVSGKDAKGIIEAILKRSEFL